MAFKAVKSVGAGATRCPIPDGVVPGDLLFAFGSADGNYSTGGSGLAWKPVDEGGNNWVQGTHSVLGSDMTPEWSLGSGVVELNFLFYELDALVASRIADGTEGHYVDFLGFSNNPFYNWIGAAVIVYSGEPEPAPNGISLSATNHATIHSTNVRNPGENYPLQLVLPESPNDYPDDQRLYYIAAVDGRQPYSIFKADNRLRARVYLTMGIYQWYLAWFDEVLPAGQPYPSRTIELTGNPWRYGSFGRLIHSATTVGEEHPLEIPHARRIQAPALPYQLHTGTLGMSR
jgi:hypothetical protein